jgi:hypothetical protein
MSGDAIARFKEAQQGLILLKVRLVEKALDGIEKVYLIEMAACAARRAPHVVLGRSDPRSGGGLALKMANVAHSAKTSALSGIPMKLSPSSPPPSLILTSIRNCRYLRHFKSFVRASINASILAFACSQSAFSGSSPPRCQNLTSKPRQRRIEL